MVVLFVDMDYFFAACEELRHPELRGKPLIVGTAKASERTRGVVQTCNYEARKFGIHSGMPNLQALKLKPDVNYLESDDEYYESISATVMQTLRNHGFRMEIMSVDEAALDLGKLNMEDAIALGKEIKSEIGNGLKLPCTVGISTGKTYAKMECEASKPDGLGVLKQEEIHDFLKDLTVRKIPGVGGKTAERLKSMGIDTIGKLSGTDPNVLISGLGSFGKELYLIANGKDPYRVDDREILLSIGRELSLRRDSDDVDEMGDSFRNLVHETMDEVRKQNVWFKAIAAKVRYPDHSERIRNRSLSGYADNEELVYDVGITLLKELLESGKVHKIGIRVSNLVKKGGQRTLF